VEKDCAGSCGQGSKSLPGMQEPSAADGRRPGGKGQIKNPTNFRRKKDWEGYRRGINARRIEGGGWGWGGGWGKKRKVREGRKRKTGAERKKRTPNGHDVTRSAACMYNLIPGTSVKRKQVSQKNTGKSVTKKGMTDHGGGRQVTSPKSTETTPPSKNWEGGKEKRAQRGRNGEGARQFVRQLCSLKTMYWHKWGSNY